MDAVFLGSNYGLTPDPWQEAVLEGWLGQRPDGKWAASRCGLAVPRQNGKNAVLEIRELYGMVMLGERILHTAHEVKTARKAFLRLCSFFENERDYPELADMVVSIRKTNGQEAIVLSNGGQVEFVARSKGSARGFTVDVLVMDEAQELGNEALEALLPTISAGPKQNPQQIVTGTPPGPSANGEIFTAWRDQGVAGKDRRLCWLEWSCPANVDLDDPAAAAAANPALGRRLNWDTVQDERASLSDEGFARERLGMWAGIASNRVISAELWDSLRVDDVKLSRPVVFGLDVTPGRERAAIGAAWLQGDRLVVEGVQHEHGTAWVVDRLKELQERWQPAAVVLDSAGPAASLIPDLERARVRRLLVTNTSDMKQACGQFYDAAIQNRLGHSGQPGLDLALAHAEKRVLQDAWAWSRKDSSVDISPLVAVTLAAYGLTKKRPKGDGKPYKAVIM